MTNKHQQLNLLDFIETKPSFDPQKSLFPHNCIDINELKDTKKLKEKLEKFKKILDDDNVKELEISRFIKEEKAYFIIASLLNKYYDFGHHSAYVFSEFQLGNSFKVDYLIVGKSSSGHEFVFVELESPTGNITVAQKYSGEVIRKGINQITDWQNWLEEHNSSIKETFNKLKHHDYSLQRRKKLGGRRKKEEGYSIIKNFNCGYKAHLK